VCSVGRPTLVRPPCLTPSPISHCLPYRPCPCTVQATESKRPQPAYGPSFYMAESHDHKDDRYELSKSGLLTGLRRAPPSPFMDSLMTHEGCGTIWHQLT
jgi:hypothetical protein